MLPAMFRSLGLLPFALLVACAPAAPSVPPTNPATTKSGTAAERTERADEAIALVESVPAGAMADDPAIANTDDTWRTMIASATSSIAIGEFYVAEKPGDAPYIDRLAPVIDELARAVKRGVSVRFLIDAGFAKKYPGSADRLKTLGITVREFDASKSMGGILHAKYLVVDAQLSYLGSANFDWRSLDHIHELGLRIRSARIAATLLSAFDADWAASGGERTPPRAFGDPVVPELVAGEPVEALLSPKGYLADPRLWDLDRIVAAIDGAQRELRVQLLSFETVGHDGAKFDVLDAALRRAAVRGVRVHVMLSNWQKAAKKIGAAQALARVPGIEVRFVNVPAAEGGFIPFARVVHAKYLVIDDSLVWLGTSNWGGDYFFKSRNVGVLVRSPRLAKQLIGVFEGLASGPLSEPVEPDKAYEPPRVAN